MKIKMLKRFMGQYMILSLFVFFLVFSIITGFIFQIRKINEYKGQIAQINNQIEDTKEEISKLEKICKSNDLESAAREQLGMVKSNEIIYVDSSERDN
ncbi:MAG: septum formation initiator family protein [Terrisporobacter othiniensis]|uniref:Septum formation initiator family protein n=1 Tax=Terrisporobacter hibernicus TaxID=2813371 RepID=A0AAX2ZKS2_9FIRM|nr:MULTISPECIES: septum formation initiator family protein [Terrisporobacter]MDU4861305.1 septum formation initiator family protein [Terrisporobacter othiniensis]MDU6994939.1 septum formation initiator family protein [Terrisporobacter othiniensis]UEL49420.1 septum formation initiator family protein [Terrisporobacter hibernicus]SFJ55610.1 Cell division protein FtsB [Terrisporobacter glycolicus]